MKNTLSIVTLSIALSACASLPKPSASEASPASASSDTSLAKKQSFVHKTSMKAARPSAKDPLPDVELTEDLLYKLLTAEIAYQRGDWQTGYVATLSVAQQTRDPRLAQRAAEMALGAKQADKALSAVRLWRELAPHDEEATQYYLSFAILSGHLNEARPILQTRLANASPRTRASLAFQIQRLLAHARDKAAAFALLQELLAPYPDMTEAHLALSQGAFSIGDTRRAQQEARIALKEKPDSELAMLTLAQAMPDQHKKAAELLADFLVRYPQARNVRIAYARMMIREQQYTKARDAFDILLKNQPQDLTSLYALGVLGLQTNDLDAAERYLTTYLKVLTAQPDEERDPAQALLLLAQIAEERKNTDAELKWLGQIEPGAAYLGAQIKRAQIIARRGDIKTARHLLHAMDTHGEAEQVRVVLTEGQILRDAHRLPEALTVFRDALKNYPDNTNLLYDYAMTAEQSNQMRVMEKSLRKIIRLAPNNQNAYNALGYSFADRNIRLKEAHALIAKALRLAPEDPYIMDSMGWVEYRQGKLKQAEALLRRAYEQRADVEIAAHLGEVLWVKGKKQDAEKFWRDAQTRDPQNDTLKSTLARLNVSL